MATDKDNEGTATPGVQFEAPPKREKAEKAPKPPKSQKILPAHLRSGRIPGDPRPSVPIIGGSRRFGAYTRPVSINISEQMLPPITRKKIATYEVMAFSKKDPLVKEGDATIDPSPVILPGRYSIHDRYEKDLANAIKVIQNVVGKERLDVRNPITGKNESQMVDNIEDIIMENGFLTVNMETEYMKYVFMELHPMNATNKWRDQAKQGAVFRRQDFQYQSNVSRMFDMDLAMDAEKMVLKFEKDEVMGYAAAFGMPTVGRPIHEIRYDLRIIARQDPKKLMFQAQDHYAAVRINVKDAMDWGLIDYVPEKMSYFFAADYVNPIHTVAVGEDPQESLAQFCLTEEGDAPYSEIEQLLSFWK
jgi:hypothetical protein